MLPTASSRFRGVIFPHASCLLMRSCLLMGNGGNTWETRRNATSQNFKANKWLFTAKQRNFAEAIHSVFWYHSHLSRVSPRAFACSKHLQNQQNMKISPHTIWLCFSAFPPYLSSFIPKRQLVKGRLLPYGLWLLFLHFEP